MLQVTSFKKNHKWNDKVNVYTKNEIVNVWNITILAPSQSCPNKKSYYNSNEEVNVWLHKKIEPNKMLKLKWNNDVWIGLKSIS
jgi:hypothetical protein